MSEEQSRRNTCMHGAALRGVPVRAFIAYRSSLIILVSIYLALALIYNAVVPLGEGPDEPGHFAYVLFLARTGRLPVQQSTTKSDVPGEGHQPPLAYLLALPGVLWLPAAERQISLTANPQFVWSGGAEPAAFSRGSQERWPWRGAVLAWHITRSISALCGVVTVLCTWSIARRLGYTGSTALLAAALVACNPQFLFTSGLVTNDALLAALSAGALLVAVGRRETRGDMQRWLLPTGDWRLPAVLLGLLIGLALFTKQSAIMLLALVPLAAWRQHPRQWRRCLSFVALCLATVALIAGWWYWRNFRLYGDMLGLAAFQDTFLTQRWDWRDLRAWGGALVQLHESFWGRFGWMSVSAPGWIYWLIEAIELAAAGRLVYQFSGRLRATRTSDLACLFILPVLACAWTGSFALTAGLVAWQGRFLFPALPAIAVLLAHGLVGRHETRDTRREIRDARYETASTTRSSFIIHRSSFFVLALLVLAVTMPFAVIAPSYVWYTLSARQALAQLGQPVDLRFAESWKRGVELRGWQVNGEARPGGTLTVTLTWHALEQIPRDWTVFIHLVDAQGAIIAEDNVQPLGGRLPMRQWTADDWIRDPHTLVLPPALQPGTYTLQAGLYDPTRRHEPMQSVWDAQGKPIDPQVRLGEVVVKREM